MAGYVRRWAYVERPSGVQSYGFEVHRFNNRPLRVSLYRKDGKLQRTDIMVPANEADIDRLCLELKRALIEGPLGQMAFDAEHGLTTTVMETETT